MQAFEHLALGQRRVAQHVGQLGGLVQIAAAVVAQVHHHVLHLLLLHVSDSLEQLRLHRQGKTIELQVADLCAIIGGDHAGRLDGRFLIFAGAEHGLAVGLCRIHRLEFEAGFLALAGREQHAVQLLDLGGVLGVDHVDALAAGSGHRHQHVTTRNALLGSRCALVNHQHTHIPRHFAFQNAQVHPVTAGRTGL